jgi:polysaccharide biosynthesis protein PslG
MVPIAGGNKLALSSRTLSFTKRVRRTSLRSSSLVVVLIPLVVLVGSYARAQSISNHAQSDKHSKHQGRSGKRHVFATYMNLITHWYTHWPEETFSAIRLWDTGTHWSQINIGPGQYDWSVVDGWMQAANTHQVGVLFTLGMTPQWASSDPNNPDCNGGPGQCAPPEDVNPDGSGTDQHWKDFVTALVQHVGPQVSFYEIWNEANNQRFWSGTNQQLIRMAKDAQTIIHNANPAARVLNAGTAAQHDQYGMDWWNSYAAAGGLQYADVISFHGCVQNFPTQCGDFPQPETLVTVMSNLRGVLKQYGQSHKTIWDTEASWGQTQPECFTDEDMQAAFLARFYLLHRSEDVHRFFWRAWIDGNGGLYIPGQGINKAGVAYQQIYSWMVGKTMIGACSSSGTVWTCDFTGPRGYAAQAIWDTSETCGNGSCRTHPYTVGTQFVDYLTLDGGKAQIKNNSVPIGAKPILVQK